MNALIIISNSGIGGSQRVAINLANWMNQLAGTSAVVVSLENFDGEKYNTTAIPYIELKKGKSKVRELISIICASHPDIVLSMGVPMAVYTVPACLATRTKHIISERNDPAHFAGRTMTRVLSRLAMRTANGFVFQTKDAQKYYGGMIARKSVIIPNPLFHMENMPDRPYLGDRKKTVVSVGRLNKQKNQKMLIEAFAEISKDFPDYSLTIWGEGPERSNLEAQIRNLGMEEKIHLPGTSDKVLEEIYDEGVFVLCSDFEGMPNALMEAMALGLPCISTDCPCGGPKDLIRDGENGVLIEVGKKELLVQAMRRILSDSEFAGKISQKAAMIRMHYSEDNICKRWFEFMGRV